jgi:hypothetical protein
VVSARVGYTSGGALPARVPTLRARGPPRGGGTRRALAPRMQIQRTVSRTETYTTQETRSGTRSDGAGGTESYTYTEDVQRLRVVNDVVTEEVPDPVPPQEQLLLETEWAEEVEAEAETEPMTGEEAIAILDRDFDTFDTADQGGSTDGRVSEDDLRAVAENEDERFTEEQQQAAQVLVDSPTYRNFVDVGAGRGDVDGTISRSDVDGAVATLATGTYQDELLDTANGRGGRDGHIGNDDVVAALSDPAVPQETKDTLNCSSRAPRARTTSRAPWRGSPRPSWPTPARWCGAPSTPR